MITLTGGQFQDASGNLLKKGYLSLQPTQDATIVAGGQVVRAVPLLFPISNGSLSGSAKIYSSAELSPQIQYYSLLLDANQKRFGDVHLWAFPQGTGATVDLGTIVDVTGGIAFPAPVMLNPTGQQTINGFPLDLEGTGLGFSAAASATIDSAISRISAGVLAIGTAIGNALGTLRAAILQIGGSDTGLSRDSAGVIDVGNGTQGDKSGNLKLATLTLGKSDGTLPATFTNDTAGGINFTSNSGKFIEFNTQGQIVLFGSSSGTTIISPAAVASGTLGLPAATDTLVGKATTDVLTNKDLRNTGSGNAVTLLNQQGMVGAITGNGSDQTLYTFTIPANTIQAGKGFRVKWYGSNNAGATTLSLKLKIGSTTLSTFSIPATSNYNETAEIFNNAGVQNAQTWAAGAQAGTGTLFDTFGTSAENFANAIAVTITGNIANPNTFQGGLFMVELIQ